MDIGAFFDKKEWKNICDSGIVNLGNNYRIKKVIEKAQKGKTIKIGFIGGSITAGSLSSTPYNCYAYLVYKWWKDSFPMANTEYINAGIGATTSQLGVARVKDDLLCYEPDVVFVEFSVNDSNEEKFMETYEGLIRRILSQPQEPAVIIINNVCYDNGDNAQDIHNKVGMHYDLPIVSIKNSIYKEIEKGKPKADDITPDNLHPNDFGHRIVADVIINLLETLYHMETKSLPYKLPGQTLTKNRYYDSKLWNNSNMKPELSGFVSDESKKEGLWDVFKLGWYGSNVGSRISFSVECSGLSVLYKKYAKKEHTDNLAPTAKLVVDNNEENAIILDSRFDQDWGDCLFLQDILSDNAKEKHLIDIVITSQTEGRDFYLASIITA